MVRRLVVIDPVPRVGRTFVAETAAETQDRLDAERRARVAARCVHYNGIHRDHCEAGIEYESVRDASSGPEAARFPCVKIEGLKPCSVRCASRRDPTTMEIDYELRR